jgi:hypothetical protein
VAEPDPADSSGTDGGFATGRADGSGRGRSVVVSSSMPAKALGSTTGRLASGPCESFPRASETELSRDSNVAAGPSPVGVGERRKSASLGASPGFVAVRGRAVMKNGSSSAIDASRRGRPPPRASTSSRPTVLLAIAAFSSRSAWNSSVFPSTVRTVHTSGAPAVSGRRTRNRCPHWVQRTLVPCADTSASSNS